MFDILKNLADGSITPAQARTQLMGRLGTHTMLAERGGRSRPTHLHLAEEAMLGLCILREGHGDPQDSCGRMRRRLDKAQASESKHARDWQAFSRWSRQHETSRVPVTLSPALRVSDEQMAAQLETLRRIRVGMKHATRAATP